jgi:hypothetical protein
LDIQGSKAADKLGLDSDSEDSSGERFGKSVAKNRKKGNDDKMCSLYGLKWLRVVIG